MYVEGGKLFYTIPLHKVDKIKKRRLLTFKEEFHFTLLVKSKAIGEVLLVCKTVQSLMERCLCLKAYTLYKSQITIAQVI